MDYTVGILGLQGAFLKHVEVLSKLNVRTKIIRYSEELNECCGLVIPGGESTTMTKLMEEMDLYDRIANFQGVIFGTCAGAILLSTDASDPKVRPLKRVPVKIKRNAYGRQVDSFTAPINLTFDPQVFKGVFIRAPKFEEVDRNVEVLGTFNNEPVLIKYGKNLLATFHPELTPDPRIHQYFIKMIEDNPKK